MMDGEGGTQTTMSYEPSVDDDSSQDTKILNAFRIIVCVLGVLGNMIVISVVILSKDFKRGTIHWYVLQLALADSIFLLTIPIRVVEDSSGWIFSDGACKVKNCILYINYYNSVLFLMVMALDRYFAICHSFSERFSFLRTHRAAYVVTAVVWVISISLAVPVMLYSEKTGEEPRCVCQFRFPPNYYEYCKTRGYRGKGLEFCTTTLAGHKDQGCRPRIVQNSDIVKSSTFSANFTEDSSFSAVTLTTTIPFDSSSSVYFTTTSQVELTTESSGETSMRNLMSTTAADKKERKQVRYEPGCSYEAVENGYIQFLIFNFAGMFIIPFTVITICYTLIVLKVRKSRFKNFKEDRPVTTAQKREDRTKRRVTIMCMALVIVFALCWLPYNLQNMVLIRGIQQTEKFCLNFHRVTSLLLFLNSAINPYIYIFGASFKTKFKRLKKNFAGTVIFSHFTRTTHLESRSSGSKSEEHRKLNERGDKSFGTEMKVQEITAV